MRKLGFNDEVDAVEQKKCPYCKRIYEFSYDQEAYKLG